MKTWLTADWHLGDDRFQLMGLPFKTREEMIDTLIKNHNELVKPDDLVVVVGDAVYQKAPEFLPYVGRFNGKKALIRGNHDRVFTDEQLAPYFTKIVKEGGGISVDNVVRDVTCFITHYPTQGRKDMFNLVGHVHGAWKYQLNMFNVGMFTNNFRPISIEDIQFHFDAVTKFYDDDVWVGYNEINSEYIGKRGKKGRYFIPETI